MKYLLSIVAMGLVLSAAAVAQSTGAPSRSQYPAWTGANYTFGRHLSVMLLHLDGAALAMAQAAQQNATSTSVKRLAADVAAQRSHEINSLGAAYQKQYGAAMPSWGGGNGMMGGASGMAGGGMAGGNMSGGGAMGQMMSYGDRYQMMMSNRADWWGSSNADSGFVPALMRLDAMQISMATMGLRSKDAAAVSLSRTVVSSRVAELGRLSKLL